MSEDVAIHAGIVFARTLFGPSTSDPVFLCSLPNEKGDTKQPGERSIMGRDDAPLIAFINRWDRPYRGCFICTSTIRNGTRRNKENAVETPALYVDIDFKSIMQDQAAALRALAECRMIPSVVVHSGHGLHAWWLFKEAVQTQANLERLEAALRQLADTFGGDMQVTHPAALMRLPGTHNTKGGQWLDVTATISDFRYELEDLEEWFAEQSPILRRKERPPAPEKNPFLTISEKLGFKPTIDVEERLSAMTYQGAGDTAVHVTQRAVSASMLSRGHELEEVVTLLLDATRAAAGEYGQRWNWRREETNIRKMCQTWLAKIDRPQADRAQAEIVNIAQARATRAKPQAAAIAPSKAKKFHVIAEAVLSSLRHSLLFENGLVWHYADHIWSKLDEPKTWLQVRIEEVCRQLNVNSDNRLISETRAWLERNPDLFVERIAWDQHGMVPTRNGLIDPLTLELTPARSEHRVTWRVNCDYEPNALCPTWLQMLADAFADRSEESRNVIISTLQEVLGAALIDRKPRALQKALVLIGGHDCGKSQLLAVCAGLFGNVSISQPLAAVDGAHGLMPFQRRLPWVLDEAFDQSVWHMSSIVKTLITQENISINIKHGPLISQQFKGPIFWGTNHPPQFRESTRAIVERMVVVDCRQKFTAHRPIGAAVTAALARFSGPGAYVVAKELPGVLVWALAGLQRAMVHGFIELGGESAAAATEIYRDSNLVAGFVDECIELDPDCRISMPDFSIAFAAWWLENKGENRGLPSNDSIGRALVALHDPRIVTDRKELRDNSKRYVAGIRFNVDGLEYFERGITNDLFQGKTVQTSNVGNNPNKLIPAAWDAKPVVVAMRAAHINGCEKEVSRVVTLESVSAKSVIEKRHASQMIDSSSEPLF